MFSATLIFRIPGNFTYTRSHHTCFIEVICATLTEDAQVVSALESLYSRSKSTYIAGSRPAT